jgi:hypothetical protein
MKARQEHSNYKISYHITWLIPCCVRYL